MHDHVVTRVLPGLGRARGMDLQPVNEVDVAPFLDRQFPWVQDGRRALLAPREV